MKAINIFFFVLSMTNREISHLGLQINTNGYLHDMPYFFSYNEK